MSANKSCGNDVDAVTVVVERHFIDQRWADRIGRVNHAAVRRVTKLGARYGTVGPCPKGRAKVLVHLLGNEVAEHRKLAAEVVINADDFFAKIRWRIIAALELCSYVRSGENSSVFTTGG